MCGRFTLRTPAGQVAEAFGLDEPPDWSPRYNLAPTQTVLAVRWDAEAQRRVAVGLRWGLIPFWADDPKFGYRTINARAETVESKPAFRAAFKRRRCLVVADGFYEWQPRDGQKQPYYFCRRDQQPFGLAGLWEHWEGEGGVIESCTIIVTEASPLTAPYHDRSPVILDPEAYPVWLDPEFADTGELKRLLQPDAGEDFEAYPVGTRVNSPKHDGPECIQRVSD